MQAAPSSRTLAIKERLYPGHMHPYRIYERLIDQRATPGSVVLDYGCGRTAPDLQRLRGRSLKLIGIDLVEFTVDIPEITLIGISLDPSRRSLAIADASVDLVICRSVVEHLVDPTHVFSEFARVLKSGGSVIFLTANAWDYASVIARIVPNRFHGKVVAATEGRDEQDTFPTEYRCNTETSIQKLAQSTGFKVRQIDFLNQYPSYLMFSLPLFFLGTAYERLTSKYGALKKLRGWILCELQK
jgi:SAM-dependent methyltransferase